MAGPGGAAGALRNAHMMPAVPGAPPDASMAFRLDARAVVTIHAPGLELLDGGLFNGLDGGCHGRHRQRGEQDLGLC